MYTVNNVIDVLNSFAPPTLAESWDSIGLMVGSKKQAISKVLCALDLNGEVVEEAIAVGANLIVTHHPFIFKPIKNIDCDTPMGSIIQKLIKHDIAVFSMHTNFDVTTGGINDYLAERIGLCDIQPLQVTSSYKLQKLVVYVPQTHYEVVRAALTAHNEATIGNYKGCTFGAQGTGTFIPLEGSQPYLGQVHTLEEVKEVKLECLAEPREIPALMEVIKKVHPYEEVAYDVYNLENIEHCEGIGRVGACEPIKVSAFIETLKHLFNIPYVRLVAKEDRVISKIALCSGSGGSFIGIAAAKADLYITGDVSFHEAQEALSKGLVVVDVGHYASENIAMPVIENYLSKCFEEMEVLCSKVNGETFQTL